MALDSLYCAWQKANYPYEFYEVMLQHFSEKGKKDKVTLIKQEMLKAFDISEGGYKFRNDNRTFSSDKNNKCIIPSLVSIKGLSQVCADDLYNIKNEKFDSFIDLLYRLKTTSVKSNQLDILIKLDYFSEFGDINKLLNIVKVFDELNDKSSLKKDKLKEFNLTEELVRKHSASETETRTEEIDCLKYLTDHNISEDPDCMKYKFIKDEFGKTKEKIPNGYSTKKTIKKYQISQEEQEKYASKIVVGKFSEIDMGGLLSELFETMQFVKCSVKSKLMYQKEHLGYINMKLRVPDTYYYITLMDGKYSNKIVSLYQLRTGNTVKMKVKGKTLEEYPLVEGDIINVVESKEENKWGRKDGQFYMKDEKETILKKYNYVR